MSAQAVSEFIDQLKVKLWSGSDDELSQALGIGKSTIASWRRRGSLPSRIKKEYLYKYGVDYQLIESGVPSEEQIYQKLFEAAFYMCIMRLARSVEENDLADIGGWLAAHDAELRGYLIWPIANGLYSPANKFAAYQRLVSEAASGEALTLEAFRLLQQSVAENADDRGGA